MQTNVARMTSSVLAMIGFLSYTTNSYAAEMGVNAWEKVLLNISSSLTGPVAYAISIIAIATCGIVMAFSDLQGGAKRFIQAACGLSIAFFSVQITTQFLGFSGAIL